MNAEDEHAIVPVGNKTIQLALTYDLTEPKPVIPGAAGTINVEGNSTIYAPLFAASSPLDALQVSDRVTAVSSIVVNESVGAASVGVATVVLSLKNTS